MSKIEVNEIDKQSGSTLTIGGSGTTVQLGTGASQTGFGREGSVDWQTGSIKTAATFTAASGEGYFVDTSSNEITANLPAGSAGAIVAFSDYARNFASNKLTVTPNGSEKIGGVNASVFASVDGQALTLVYVDSTKGWINVQNAEDTEQGIVPAFIAATGGTETTVCTNFKVHTFTGPGTFCVSNTGNAAGSNTFSYVVVAGGASGGKSDRVGGGGAGGYRESKASSDSYTASPLNATSGSFFNLAATAGGTPVTVGAGGASQTSPTAKGNDGSNSVFSTVTSAGGGGGATSGPFPSSPLEGNNGGSGGGGGGSCNVHPSPFNGGTGGTGNTPSVSPPQGNNGGRGNHEPGCWAAGGGGGGAGAAGQNVIERPDPGPGAYAGDGGAGVASSITGSPVTRGGGGGGVGAGTSDNNGGAGSGGGGAGNASGVGGSGTANTGGGGGGGSAPSPGSGAGGSGIVIIRYRFQ